MELVDNHGIAVAMLDADDYAAGDWWPAAAAVDVIRVPRPPAELWPGLRADGFVVKPTTVTWLADVADSDEAFIAGLSESKRTRVRRARTRANECGLRVVVEDPLTEDGFDRFLELYEPAVARMRYGYPVAGRFRDQVLSGTPNHYAMSAYLGPELVAMSIYSESSEDELIRGRFSAASDVAKERDFVKVLYLAAVGVARAKGYPQMTLGNDPNLYGHLCAPGLITFKRSFGFRPMASQWLGDPRGFDEADLLPSLARLSDPTVLLGYTDADTEGGDVLHSFVVSDDPTVDARPFTGGHMDGATVSAPVTLL